MTSFTIGGTQLSEIGSARRTYPVGRVCIADGCPTILTVYNPNDKCFFHQPFKRPRLRGRLAPSEAMESVKLSKCGSCSQRFRHWRDAIGEINEIVIDGRVHREGSNGRATLCEGPYDNRRP